MKNTLLPVSILVVVLATCATAQANDLYRNSRATASRSKASDDADRLWTKLPEKKRKILHETMAEAYQKNEILREKAERLRKELGALLVAPKFDKGTYLNKNAKLSVLTAKMRTNMSDAFADVAGQFTVDERKILEKLHEMQHNRPDYYVEWHHEGQPKEIPHSYDEEPDKTPD